MKKDDYIAITAIGIQMANDGKVAYTLKEISKLIDLEARRIAREFDERGILASVVGKTKYYTPVDIAQYMYSVRVAPLQPICSRGKATRRS